MNTTTFIAEENQSSSQGIIDLQLLESIKDLTDSIIIIDLAKKIIKWKSSKFQDEFLELNKEDISIPPLFELFPEISKLTERKIFFEKNIENNKTFKTTLLNSKTEKTHNIQAVIYEKRYLSILFDNIETRNYEIQRHLEDREALFSTSRTLSMSEMASTLAHEINQPIGTISNYLRGIKTYIAKDNINRYEILKVIDDAIEQNNFASDIINRIRGFTKSRQPDITPINTGKLIEKCLSLLDWEISKESIAITINDSIDHPVLNDISKVRIMGDKTMLQQVFINLFRNSIDAMKKQPENCRFISISAYIDRENIEIQIRDTGVGLAEQDLNNLFIPFSSTKTNGMGIGLNICRSFIELHQGRLWISPNRNRKKFETETLYRRIRKP